MNKQNTEKIFNDFPELFKDRTNMLQSLMCFGFECGDGWYNRIYNLCKDIQEWFMKNRKEIPSHFSVQQVKEKFGSLRFYITAAPVEIHNLIRNAEHDSYFICENCGDDIRTHTFNDKKYHSYHRDDLPWIVTLCDDCLRERISNRNIKDSDYISNWQKRHKAPYVVVK